MLPLSRRLLDEGKGLGAEQHDVVMQHCIERSRRASRTSLLGYDISPLFPEASHISLPIDCTSNLVHFTR